MMIMGADSSILKALGPKSWADSIKTKREREKD